MGFVVEEGNASDTGFAYFYADRNRADHQDPVAILRSLVRQLCAPRDASSVDACVEDKYKERKRKGFAGHILVTEECHELLLQLVRVQRETYLVIDGLDECNRETRHVLMNILDDLADKSGRPIKICIASRSDQDLRSRYQGGAHLEVTANDNQADIEKFVIEKMKQSKFCCTKITPAVREQVLKAFQDKSQGIGLEAAYDKILQNISNQTGCKGDVAFPAFKIAMVSRRPLSPYEMVAAVVQDPGMDFCIDEDVDIEYLLEVCHNLLIVTDGSLEKPVEADRGNFRTDYNLMGGYQYQIIDDNENISQSVEATRSASYICRFSHLYLQEYLESKHWSTQESEAFMAGTCLRTLLSFRISDNPSSGNLPKRGADTANENGPSEQTILWVAEVEMKTKLQVIWDPGCHDENKMTFPEQLPESHNSSHLKTQPVKSQPPPFQCFVELVDVRSNKDDKSYESIIFNLYIEGRRNSGVGGWAAYASQTFASHVRSAVYAKGLHPTTSGLLVKFTGTPAKRRPSAPLGSRDMFHSRPLLRPPSEPALGCALLGLEQTLQAWLEEGSLENIVQNERGDSLLALAIESEYTQVCDLLLNHGASPNMKDSRGMNPLDIAVRKGNEAIVTALLKAGAHPNLHSSKVENNPLITAVKLDDIGITRELLQHGGDISLGYQKMSDKSPLVLAVGQSNVDLVALLLEHVHNLPRGEYQGIIRRALEETFKVEQDSVAAILKPLMPHATELEGLLTLPLAVLKGNWALAEALIGLRVDVNARNDNFNTPLLYIVHQGCEEKPRKLKQLIDWGANVNAVDSYGQSALHVCINQYSDHSHKGEDSCGEVISLLLDNGADPNAADKKGTPLFVAVCLDVSVPLDIIRMLINTGADLNKAAGAERHFMTPLDAAELRIAPIEKLAMGQTRLRKSTAKVVIIKKPLATSAKTRKGKHDSSRMKLDARRFQSLPLQSHPLLPPKKSVLESADAATTLIMALVI